MPPLGGDRRLHELQPTNIEPGVGISTPCGRYLFGGSSFSSPVCRGCRGMEGFQVRGWDLFLSRWRWLHEPQPISNQSEGLCFYTVPWRYRAGGSPISSPVSWSWRSTEIFLTPVLPRCRWLHGHHSAASRIKFKMTVGELDAALDVFRILRLLHVVSTTTVVLYQ